MSNLNLLLSISLFVIYSCSNDNSISNCIKSSNLVSEYTNSDGDQIQIYENGQAYAQNQDCAMLGQIFEPGFLEQSYETTSDGIFIKGDGDQRFPVFESFTWDFESVADWRELLISDLSDRDRIFGNVTFQGPATPTVQEYVDLQKCLLTKQCDFIDNKIELAVDPMDNSNQVLRFYAAAPTEDMVTSKSSIATSALLFKKGEDFWFQARYFIEKGRPLTIADFESGFFLGHMGPRLIFRGQELSVENKFGVKLIYRQPSNQAIDFPIGKWITVKAHMRYDDNEGIIQVWQDDQLILDAIGKNIPFPFWVQNILEIGISACQEETSLLIDDVKFGPVDFD